MIGKANFLILNCLFIHNNIGPITLKKLALFINTELITILKETILKDSRASIAQCL